MQKNDGNIKICLLTCVMKSFNVLFMEPTNSVPLARKLRNNKNQVIKLWSDWGLKMLGVNLPNLCTTNVDGVQFLRCQEVFSFHQKVERLVVLKELIMFLLGLRFRGKNLGHFIKPFNNDIAVIAYKTRAVVIRSIYRELALKNILELHSGSSHE